jgi:hypothetical protein
MEESILPQTPPTPPGQIQLLCPQCHQPVTPTEYFCPNCGKKLNEPSLSTDLTAQILLYGFSIILPIICFLAVSYWQGIKYIKSGDPAAKQMGWIALGLMAASTIITFWLAGIWINQFIQGATSTAGLSAYGI